LNNIVVQELRILSTSQVCDHSMGLVKGLKQAHPQLFVIKENEILKLNIFIKPYYNNGFNTNDNLF
jgi:hypothetical protein